MHHSQRHVVSNVIGSPDMRIEIGSAIEMDLRDTLVLASDGLSDNLHVTEIVEYVRKGPLEQGLERDDDRITPPHALPAQWPSVEARRHDRHRLPPDEAAQAQSQRAAKSKRTSDVA